MPRQIPTLTLADTRAIITAGEKKAAEIGGPRKAEPRAGGRALSTPK